jgi:hypothetical protein
MSHNISYLNIDFAKRKEKHVMTYRYIRIVFWAAKEKGVYGIINLTSLTT